jgi:2-hydroxycyclohexanecarboxyl-CoA dehydrogenase
VTIARDMSGIADRVVVVTGASGGIGRAVVQLLAASGVRLAVTDLSADGLAEVVGEIDAGRVCRAPLDATDLDAFVGFRDRVEAELGPIDGLVNCAGLWQSEEFASIGEEAWRRLLAANLDTAFAGCSAVLPRMCARGRGSVVNVASTAGEYGSIAPAAHYAAAKGGVIGLTKSLAREAGGSGVRVNAISPGPIDTPAMGLSSPADRAAVEGRTLLGRLGRPEEVATAAAFLLGDWSSFVTGHVLRVNGGALI